MRLRVFPDDTNPKRVLTHRDPAAVRTLLAGVGVRLEHLPVAEGVEPDLDPHVLEVLFGPLIARVRLERGFVHHDVITVDEQHPAVDDLRQLFREEHTHKEDEARFLLSGSGLFLFHVGTSVLALTVERYDFVNVPAGLRHWFDMGPVPQFAALRFFNNEEGWIPHYTGDLIAERFPRHERE